MVLFITYVRQYAQSQKKGKHCQTLETSPNMLVVVYVTKFGVYMCQKVLVDTQMCVDSKSTKLVFDFSFKLRILKLYRGTYVKKICCNFRNSINTKKEHRCSNHITFSYNFLSGTLFIRCIRLFSVT